jgi:hypothetical protein
MFTLDLDIHLPDSAASDAGKLSIRIGLKQKPGQPPLTEEADRIREALYWLMARASGGRYDIDGARENFEARFLGISKARFICRYLLEQPGDDTPLIEVSDEQRGDLADCLRKLPIKLRPPQAVLERKLTFISPETRDTTAASSDMKAESSDSEADTSGARAYVSETEADAGAGVAYSSHRRTYFSDTGSAEAGKTRADSTDTETDRSDGVAPSLHLVRPVTYKGKTWFYKNLRSDHGNRKLAEFEAALFQAAWVMVGDHHAPLARPVFNQAGERVGVISSAVPEYASLGQRIEALRAANPLSRPRTADLQAQAKEVRDAGLVCLSVADYILGDVDRHAGNFGFGIIEGKPKLFGIDRDRALAELTLKYVYPDGDAKCSVKPPHPLADPWSSATRIDYGTEQLEPSRKDIDSFPLINKAAPCHWYDRTLSTRFDAFVRAMSTEADFKEQKWKNFVSHIVLLRGTLDHIAEEFITSSKGQEQFKQVFNQRIDNIESELMHIREFREWFFQHQDACLPTIKKRAAKRCAQGSWKRPPNLQADVLEAELDGLRKKAIEADWCCHLGAKIGFPPVHPESLKWMIGVDLTRPYDGRSLSDRFYFKLLLRQYRIYEGIPNTSATSVLQYHQFIDVLENIFQADFKEDDASGIRDFNEAFRCYKEILNVTKKFMFFSAHSPQARTAVAVNPAADFLSLINSVSVNHYTFNHGENARLFCALFQLFIAAKQSQHIIDENQKCGEEAIDRVFQYFRSVLQQHCFSGALKKSRDEFLVVFDMLITHQVGEGGKVSDLPWKDVFRYADILLKTYQYINTPKEHAGDFGECIQSVIRDKHLKVPLQYKYLLAGTMLHLFGDGVVGCSVIAFMTIAGLTTPISAVGLASAFLLATGIVTALAGLTASGCGGYLFFSGRERKLASPMKQMPKTKQIKQLTMIQKPSTPASTSLGS